MTAIVHIMVDIESLGTRPGFIVLGAAFMRVGDEASMSVNFSVPDQQALGLEIDPGTHAWWGEQEAAHPGLWATTTENPQPLAAALPYIANWIAWAHGGADWRLWCSAPSMDGSMIDEIYRRSGATSPLDHWRVRCVRTACELAGVDRNQFRVEPAHSALADATGQSRALVAAFQKLAGLMTT